MELPPGELVATTLAMLLVVMLYQRQVTRLMTQQHTADHLLPTCRTLAAMIAASGADCLAPILVAMQNAHFRSTWITVYSRSGEVWADSFKPCYGQLPMPPSQSQVAAFEAAARAGVMSDDHPRGIQAVMWGRSISTNADATISVAAVRAGDLIVAMQACGNETF
jgi:hypothetical protein